ncbi:hypothetical protein M404DRAFT_382699 [Pisolithus tinctorius Marx 270]|uniref:Uncharacterized protein n=1 Tax=Pisolithus tinctorius Marx 270 TaxID=870435 RepID=A0A0C3N064_PISTI|nr:hypothetical protein M404DRAFT_382699 [Pisolithus tinctorius Marx 270]
MKFSSCRNARFCSPSPASMPEILGQPLQALQSAQQHPCTAVGPPTTFPSPEFHFRVLREGSPRRSEFPSQ